MEQKLFTVVEAAAILKVGRTRIFELIKTRELESIKIGGSRRIPLDAIDEYIKVRRAAA